ncbi:hypothetical protein IP69_06595 [Bosea sp. AAP35]|nr:hypothetical protein IP69_06595 [Bosea sp. AAP35]
MPDATLLARIAERMNDPSDAMTADASAAVSREPLKQDAAKIGGRRIDCRGARTETRALVLAGLRRFDPAMTTW